MGITTNGATTGEHRAIEAGEPALDLATAKAWLRLATDDDDALVGDLVRVAADTCESFIGQMLVERQCRSVVAGGGAWRWLGLRPVRAIVGVAILAADGTETVLAADRYETDIDADGDGWIRLRGGGNGGGARIAVLYRAGLSETPDGVPVAIGQGLLRMVAHLYATRGEGDRAPPAAVAALWRPWRRMRL